MDFDDYEPTVSLKETDLEKLILEGTGIEFEVENYKKDEDEEKHFFKPEDVLSNTYIPEDDSEDDDEGLSPFEKLAKKMEDISGDGGVKKRILHPGGGSIVPDDAIVRLHYNAYLEYADEPFDSTILRNAPKHFTLGKGEVLVGLEIAVRTMKKGEVAQLLIRPEYAFLKMGVTPRIAQKATVMFKVELLHFVEHAGIEEYDMMTKEDRDTIEFTQILKFVEMQSQLGKQQYNEKSYKNAFSHYKRALKVLEYRSVKDAGEQKIQDDKLLTLYTNMAICLSKQNKFEQVITYCKKGRQFSRNNANTANVCKLFFLQGKANRRCSNFEAARDLLKKAQRMNPNNPDINTELQQLDIDVRKFNELEKVRCKKMFSRPTGHSKADKEREDKQMKDKEDKACKVSEEFEIMVEEKLLEFIEDKDQDEMPFPAINLNVGEISCLIEKAENLGLDYKQIGSGSSLRLKITKVPNNNG